MTMEIPPLPPAPVVAPDPKPARPPSDAQLVVSLNIVWAIAIIAVSLTIAGVWTHQWVLVSGLIGTGLGSLATALNAPTGVSNALIAAKKAMTP